MPLRLVSPYALRCQEPTTWLAAIPALSCSRNLLPSTLSSIVLSFDGLCTWLCFLSTSTRCIDIACVIATSSHDQSTETYRETVIAMHHAVQQRFRNMLFHNAVPQRVVTNLSPPPDNNMAAGLDTGPAPERGIRPETTSATMEWTKNEKKIENPNRAYGMRRTDELLAPRRNSHSI